MSLAAILAAHVHFGDLSPVEWAIVGLAAVAAAWTIWKAVAYTLRPGEEGADHVKRLILDDASSRARPPERPA